ncbi:MAG: efflux transporter outer membrane subunit [Planctomycetota bacterium]|nr:MAG: efflux transporter outer membrane subunit [Planctomycetota bacterium]
MALRTASTVALLLVLGCAVGPDYEEPKTATASAYEGAAQDGLSQESAAVAWWREFSDPTLDALIDRALAGNRDVAATTALLRETRALYAQETFNLAPTVTADAAYTRQLLSNATFLSGLDRSQRTFGFFSAGFDAAWELDLFGRVRRSVEAAEAEVGASDATRRDVVLSLLAEVARNYFELKGARYNLEVARKNAAIQEETLRLTIDLADGGRGTELDVARARAEHKSTLAILPPIETDVARAKNRLAVLLGVQPSGFTLETGPAGPPGPLPKLVAIGRPEDLLRRRPDIRRAERRLAAATARIGVATADLFPRLTLNASLGPEAKTVSGLFQSGAAAYSFGPTLTWAAFDLGRVAARIRAADANAEAQLDYYQLTVLEALEETENALVQYGRQRARRDTLVEAVAAAEQAASLADARYRAGAVDFLATLDAQRRVLQLQVQLAESQTRTILSLIALYKALGGGWEVGGP